jgi:hypothetical protein
MESDGIKFICTEARTAYLHNKLAQQFRWPFYCLDISFQALSLSPFSVSVFTKASCALPPIAPPALDFSLPENKY